MKKLLSICVLVIGVYAAQAQTLDFGLKAGLNFSELSNNIPAQFNATNAATGFVAGAYGRVGILGFFTQPELLYSQRKGAYTSNVDGSAVINTLSYLDVPVLFGYKLLFARVNIGPSFQFLMNANQEASDAAKDPNFSKDNFNKSVVGYQAGFGVDLSRLSVDLRYDGGLNSLGKEIVTSTGMKIDYSTRASMWQLTVGFKLF
jgi:hypothetical protein